MTSTLIPCSLCPNIYHCVGAQECDFQMTPEQIDAKIKVKQCHRCPLWDKGSGPVPMSVPPEPYKPTIAVLGEAPGQEEDRLGRPFVGPSGTLLRDTINQWADPDRMYYLNTLSCWPNRRPPTPLPTELELCNDNLALQLRAIKPEYLLVLGGVAVKAFWPNEGISTLRARWWQIPYGPDNKCWVMATYHPAYVLRRKGSEEWLDDIRYFITCARLEVNMAEAQEFQIYAGTGTKAPTSGKLQGEQEEMFPPK